MPAVRLRVSTPSTFAFCHFRRRTEEQLSVTWFHATEKLAESIKKACVFTRAAPYDIVGRLSLRKVWQLGRLLAIIEELVHRDFECSGKLLQCLDSWNRMAVFHTGHVAAKESRAFLDVALRKPLLLAQRTQSITNSHSPGPPTQMDRINDKRGYLRTYHRHR